MNKSLQKTIIKWVMIPALGDLAIRTEIKKVTPELLWQSMDEENRARFCDGYVMAMSEVLAASMEITSEELDEVKKDAAEEALNPTQDN